MVGTWHGREWWGTGANRQSKTLVLALAFRGLGLERVTAWCGADNERSQKALERLGFVHEGVLRRWHVHRGEPKDVISYSMLNDEWEAGRAGEGARGDRRRRTGAVPAALIRRPDAAWRPSPPAKRAAPRAATSSTSRPISCSSSKALPQRQAGALDRGAPVGEHRLLGKPGQLLGQLQRPFDVAARRDDLVRQADPQGLLGLHGPAGEGQLQRAAHPHDPPQALRAAVDQRHSPAPLEQAERRVLGRDAQVAPQGDLEPPGQAPAADRGDRRAWTASRA